MLHFAMYCPESHKIAAYGYFKVARLHPQTKGGQFSFKVEKIAEVLEYAGSMQFLSDSELILNLFCLVENKNCSC